MGLVTITKKKIVAVIIILLIASSVGASAWLVVPKNSLLAGIAFTEGRVAKATITITDLNGNKLYEAANATLNSGVFIEKVAWTWIWGIPKQFKITITGGTVNDEAFTGTLVRYVDNYDETSYYGKLVNYTHRSLQGPQSIPKLRNR